MADNKTSIILTAEDRASKTIKDVGGALQNLAGSAVPAAAALASLSAGAALTGLGAIAKSAIDAADGLNDMSQRTGIAVKDLAAYKLAAEQSGTSLDGIARGVKNLSTVMVDNSAALASVGITTTDTSEAMRQIADMFAVLPDGAQKSALATKLFGKAGQDLIPLLNLGREGLEKSAKAAESYSAAMERLAPEADKFNDSMSELAINLQASAAELANSFLPSLNNAITSFTLARTAGLSFFESITGFGVRGVGESLSEATAGAGKRIQELNKELARLQEGLNNQDQTDASRDVMNSRIAQVEKLLKYYKALQLSSIKSGPQFFDARDLRLAGQATLEAALNAKALNDALKDSGNSAKTVKDELGDLLNRLNAKDSGLDASFWKDLQTLNAGYKSGKLDIDAYRGAVGQLVTQQKFHTDALQAAAKAEDEWQKAVERAQKAAADSVIALQDRAAALENELATYGLTKAQIEDTIIARLEEQRALASGFDSQYELVANLEKEIDARKRAAAALRGIEGRDISKQAAEDAARAWENFSRDIEQSLTDALMRGFEAGNGFGENFVQSLKNTLKTAALKVVVQAIVSPITGQGGLLQQALGGASGAGNLLNAGSSLYNLTSGAGAAYSTGAYMMSGMGYEQAAMLAAQEVGLGTAATSSTLAAAGSSTLASVASAAPYVAAALAVASLFDSKGGPKSGGDAYYRYTDGSRALLADSGSLGTSLYGPNDSNSKIAGTLATSLSAVEQQIALLGGTVGNIDVGLGFDTDPNGTAKSRVKTRINGVDTSYDAGRSDAELQAATTKAVNDLLTEVFKSAKFDAGTEHLIDVLTGDLKLSVADTIAAIGPIKAALAGLGAPADHVTASLISASGGLDAFSGKLASYYQNFTTDAEKSAAGVAQIGQRLASVGLQTPTSIQGFKDLMAAEVALGKAGEPAVAALLDVQDAFHGIAAAAEDAVQGMLDQLDQLTPAKWIDRANSALGTSMTALPSADAVRSYLQQLQLDPIGNADKIAAAQGLFSDWKSLVGDPVATALSAVERSVSAEKDAIQRQTDATLSAIDLQITAQQAAYDAASEAVGSLSRIFDEIDSAVTALRGTIASGAAQQLAAGRGFIDQALAAAQTSGYLPDADALAKAIDAVRADGMANYATRAEYEKAQLIQAGKLDALGAITGDQLDVNQQALRIAKDQLDALQDQRDAVEQAAKAQIDGLDQQLAAAQQQVDALGGVDTSVKSVRDAVADLKTAILGALGQKATGNASGIDPTSATYAAAVASSNAAVKPYYDTQVSNNVALALSAAGQGNLTDTKAFAAEAIKYGTAASIAAEVAAQTHDSTWTADKLIQWARDNGVQGYASGGIASGLSLVGEQGPELVVTPPARILNNGDTSRLFDVAALLDEIKALRGTVERQQTALDRIAGNTGMAADALNGRGQQPMLVEVAA